MADSPYKGLTPYQEEDRKYFFGRKAEEEIISANLIASRMTLLYGASGVGKSSVLRAGVVGYLNQQAEDNVNRYGKPEIVTVVFNNWRDDPIPNMLESARTAVTAMVKDSKDKNLRPLSSRTETLEKWTEVVDGELLIILDQFEEYFLYHSDENGDEAFDLEFPRIVNNPNLRVNFLISIREDSLAKLDRFKGRIPNLFDNYLRIDHLDHSAATEAILKPVEQYNRDQYGNESGISIEPDLVKLVLEQVEAGQVIWGEKGRGTVENGAKSSNGQARIETPYLQLVMTRLWEEECGVESNILRAETLRSLGGAEKIVRAHVADAMDALSDEHRKTASQIFHYLVTPSGTKIAHTVPDLAAYTKLPKTKVKSLLEKLAESEVRISRPVASAGKKAANRYELFHDVLTHAIMFWRSQYIQKEESETAAREAAELLEKTRKELELERTKKSAKRLKRLTLGLAGLSVFAIMAVALVFERWNEVSRKEQIASAARDSTATLLRLSRSRALAVSAITSLEKDPDSSMRQALAALEITSSDNVFVPEAENALRRSFEVSKLEYTLKGHSLDVTDVAFRPDGDEVATVGKDGKLLLWDMRTQQQRVLGVCEARVRSMAFNQKGDLLATGSSDNIIRIWNVTSGEQQPALTGHSGEVRSVAFSPNGRYLASGSMDNSAKIWDLETGKEIVSLLGHHGWVYSVAFSKIGGQLATVSKDGWLRFWDVTNGELLWDMEAHKKRTQAVEVLDVAFSPNGRHFATAGSDGRARIWDSKKRQLIVTLQGHNNWVYAIAFSPDGNRLATASFDKTAKLWDASNGRELTTFAGHSDWLYGVAFSPDGEYLATASRDSTAKIWRTASATELLGHKDWVYVAKFSPAGKRIATVSGDYTTRIWTADSGKQTRVYKYGSQAYDVAFSPDGKLLATVHADGWARLRDLTNDEVRVALQAHVGKVLGVAFSPDGNYLATASTDRTAKLWNVKSAQVEHTVQCQSALLDIEFSPDGKKLAAGRDDGATNVWTMESMQLLFVLSGHKEAVRSIAFDPQGRYLATAGATLSIADNSASSDEDRSQRERLVKIWDLKDGTLVRNLNGHSDEVTGVTFSRGGKQIATSSLDRTTKIWDTIKCETSDCTELQVFKGHTDGLLSVAFSPDGKYLLTSSKDRTARASLYAPRIQDLVILAKERLGRDVTARGLSKPVHTRK